MRVLTLLVATCCLFPPVFASKLINVDLRARQIAPGEPIVVAVDAPHGLSALEGRFIDKQIVFFRQGESNRWLGWTMVGLLEEPGERTLEIDGKTADGSAFAFEKVVKIEDKHFEEEHLTVEGKYVEPPKEVQERLADERRRLAEIYANRSAPLASAPFLKPVPGPPTSRFGLRRIFNGKPRSPHSGLDLRAPTGTDVVSSGPGRVVLAEDLYYSGNVVIVDHGAGLFTIYAHLSEISVEVGQQVAPGDTLGLSGATGRVTGPHLHWGAKIGNDPFDPRALLEPTLFD